MSVGRLFGSVHLEGLPFGGPLGRCVLVIVLHHPGGRAKYREVPKAETKAKLSVLLAALVPAILGAGRNTRKKGGKNERSTRQE